MSGSDVVPVIVPAQLSVAVGVVVTVAEHVPVTFGNGVTFGTGGVQPLEIVRSPPAFAVPPPVTCILKVKSLKFNVSTFILSSKVADDGISAVI